MDEQNVKAARRADLDKLTDSKFDVAVIGGGITGAGTALDLALRGLRVLVVERGDWAASTSSASSRLVHGGLRYLEQFEFSLVRESCLERALLLRNAAGLVWPESFLFPVRKGDRVGRVQLALGLSLYALLSIPRVLGVPKLMGRKRACKFLPQVKRDSLRGAGQYLDGATDDARLTLAVLLSAKNAGATCLSRVELTKLESQASGAVLQLEDKLRVAADKESGSQSIRVEADCVVLAGGPATEELRGRSGLGGDWISPTRGSHILVPRERLPTDGAVIFPSSIDGRVMFLIPWPRYTVIGTTDLDADASQRPYATAEEVAYLLRSANDLLPASNLSQDDVVSTWSGLRPLLAAPEDNPSARSREERIEREQSVFTIAGGKLTGYRSMAENLAARIVKHLGRGRAGRISPTRNYRLRGSLEHPVPRPIWSGLDIDGDPESGQRTLVNAWSRRYGALAEEVRRTCAEADDGERMLDPETLLGEVNWAVAHEECWALSDFFLRRTDLGYGPVEVARAAIGPVADRMAGLLEWGPEERSRSLDEFEADLAVMHRWRQD